MTKQEQGIPLPEPVADLEEILRRVTEKEPRLGRGLRIYIARLKKEGRFEEALRIAYTRRQEKITGRYGEAEKALGVGILGIIDDQNDENAKALHELRAIWLVAAMGILNRDARVAEIEDLLDSKGPNLRAFLEGKLLGIRDEMQPFLPQQPFSFKRR